MDRPNHTTKSLFAALCLVSLCALFCLTAGCEEEMVASPQPADTPDLTEIVNADIETVAKAAENILAGASSPEPEEVIEQEAVAVNTDEIAPHDPVPETLAEADSAKPEPMAEPETVAIIADEIAQANPAPETFAEADNAKSELMAEPEAVEVSADAIALANPIPETIAEADNATPEPLVEPETAVFNADEIAENNPAAETLADTIDPEPETASETEAEAITEPVTEVGLTNPIPTESADITQDETDLASDLDNMHIANAPLLGDNTNPPEEQQEIPVQKQEVEPEEADSKGFISKYFVTPGSAVLKFTGRHFLILLFVLVCIAAWKITRRKKSYSAGPQRRTNSDG